MANDFTLGGNIPFVVTRLVNADGTFIPTSTGSQYTNFDGTLLTSVAPVASDIAGVGANNGFELPENQQASVVFHNLSAATVALQCYMPQHPSGAGWYNWLTTADFANGSVRVILGPIMRWRVGCVTVSTDATLAVSVIYRKVSYGRYA